MNSIIQRLFIGISLIFLWISCQNHDQKSPAKKPNILLIMADDMGYSDVNCYGSNIATPNIDNLAKTGIRFTNFYNAARCCPTRASLLTGLYPHEAGMGSMVSSISSNREPGPYQGYLNDSCLTIAEALKFAGYKTYMSGKWHVGEKPEYWPRKRGFDRYFGLISGASSYFEIIKDQPRVRQMALDDSLWFPPRNGFYMTDAISDHAVSFLNEHYQKDSDKPFFLYLAFTAPHWPLHAPEDEINKYLGKYNGGWDSLRNVRYEKMKELGLIDDHFVLSERPDDIPAWKDVPEADQKIWSRKMAVYAAMIDRMDQDIGNVLALLREKGEIDNTLIMFLSDNGGCHENIEGRHLNDPNVPIGLRGSYVAYNKPWANVSNTPFRKYKSWTYEGGIKTPLIIHWPATIQQSEDGKLKRNVGEIIDIMPTCLDVAGLSYDKIADKSKKAIHGMSLMPIIQGNNAQIPRTLYWEHEGCQAIRKGDWKLVMDRQIKRWELYNLKDDPTEVNNVYNQYPEIADSLTTEYDHWAHEVGVRNVQ